MTQYFDSKRSICNLFIFQSHKCFLLCIRKKVYVTEPVMNCHKIEPLFITEIIFSALYLWVEGGFYHLRHIPFFLMFLILFLVASLFSLWPFLDCVNKGAYCEGTVTFSEIAMCPLFCWLLFLENSLLVLRVFETCLSCFLLRLIVDDPFSIYDWTTWKCDTNVK